MLLSRMIVILLFFFSLLSGTLTYAQSMTPGQWVRDLYLMDSYPGTGDRRPFKDRVAVLVDEKDNIHKIFPNLAKVNDFSISNSHGQITNIIWHYFIQSPGAVATWHNDAFYTIGCAVGQLSQSTSGEQIRSYYAKEDDSGFFRWFFAKRKDGDGDEWQHLGFYDTGQNTILVAIPCDDDRFIVIGSGPDFFDKSSGRYYFLRLSTPNNDKKELRLDSYIDCGQDEVRNYMSDHDVFELASYSDIIMTDKFATLVNSKSGLYWIFSKEKASLVKSGSIFSRLKANHLDPKGFERAVLCVNPEKGGTVLISARDEELILKTDDVYKELKELSRSGFLKSSNEAHGWLTQRLKEEESKRSPYIVWYRIYPETGKVEKLVFPPEGGSLFREDGEGKSNSNGDPCPMGL